MAFEYNPIGYRFNPEVDIEDVIREFNHVGMSKGVIVALTKEFQSINEDTNPSAGTELFIPVLKPFCKQHTDGTFNFSRPYVEPIEEEPEPIVEPETEEEQDVLIPEPVVEKKIEPEVVEEEPEVEEPSVISEPEVLPNKTRNYRTYPYTFGRPNETIVGVLRLYNDMSLDGKIIQKLLVNFNEINKDALPPKMGQTVQIPVLLPFCFRHENENEIFTDGK